MRRRSRARRRRAPPRRGAAEGGCCRAGGSDPCSRLERQTLVWSRGERRQSPDRVAHFVRRLPACPCANARADRAGRHGVASGAVAERARAGPGGPEGGAGGGGRAAVPGRPAGHLLVRRRRRPAEDEQRHGDGRADHLHRHRARRLVRRRHGDQARGLPLQHPGAAQERGRRPDASTPSTGCSSAAFRSTASSSSSSTSGSASSSPRARSTGSATPTRGWRAASRRCSTRSSIRASARCCASPSRSSATWSGLSRQRVNEALKRLDESGVIRVEYGGVRVLDLERLRRYGIS